MLVSTHIRRHALAYVGKTSEELECARLLVDQATEIGNAQCICWGSYDVASALARRGGLSEALVHMQQAYSVLPNDDYFMTEAIRGSTDGYVNLQCSRYERARELAYSAWETASKHWIFIDVTLFCLPIAIEAIVGPDWLKPLKQVDRKPLRQIMRRASILYRTIPNHRPHLRRVFGRAFAALGERRKAIRNIEKALKLARTKKMTYQQAKCLLDLAAVKEQDRDVNRAEAIRLLKEMESVIPRAESWLLGDQYDEEVVEPKFDLEAWEREHGPIAPSREKAET